MAIAVPALAAQLDLLAFILTVLAAVLTIPAPFGDTTLAGRMCTLGIAGLALHNGAPFANAVLTASRSIATVDLVASRYARFRAGDQRIPPAASGKRKPSWRSSSAV
jgi:hypothetical protein